MGQTGFSQSGSSSWWGWKRTAGSKNTQFICICKAPNHNIHYLKAFYRVQSINNQRLILDLGVVLSTISIWSLWAYYLTSRVLVVFLFAGDAELRSKQTVICKKRPCTSVLPWRHHASSSPETLSSAEHQAISLPRVCERHTSASFQDRAWNSGHYRMRWWFFNEYLIKPKSFP